MSSLREKFDVEAHAVPALGDVEVALAQVARERRRLRRVGLAAVAAVAAAAAMILGGSGLVTRTSDRHPATTSSVAPSSASALPSPSATSTRLSARVEAVVLKGLAEAPARAKAQADGFSFVVSSRDGQPVDFPRSVCDPTRIIVVIEHDVVLSTDAC